MAVCVFAFIIDSVEAQEDNSELIEALLDSSTLIIAGASAFVLVILCCIAYVLIRRERRKLKERQQIKKMIPKLLISVKKKRE